MMAPPSRAPSAMKRSGLGAASTPSRYPTGMMMPPGGMPSPATVSAGGPPPQFAVFTPKPSKEEK
jgi:hypothetical protein